MTVFVLMKVTFVIGVEVTVLVACASRQVQTVPT